MNSAPDHGERKAVPCLAVDTLMALPWAERIRAYEDFDKAITLHALARQSLRRGAWDWRLDLRRARRFWRYYAVAVRAARNERIAA